MNVALHLWKPGFRHAVRSLHADLAAAVAACPPLLGGYCAVVVALDEEFDAGKGKRLVARPGEWEVGDARLFASEGAGGRAWPGSVQADLGQGQASWVLPHPGAATPDTPSAPVRVSTPQAAPPRRLAQDPAQEPPAEEPPAPSRRRAREYVVHPLPPAALVPPPIAAVAAADLQDPAQADQSAKARVARRGRKPSLPDIAPDELLLPPALMPPGTGDMTLRSLNFPKPVKARFAALGLTRLKDLAGVTVGAFSGKGPRGLKDPARLFRDRLAEELPPRRAHRETKAVDTTAEVERILALRPEARAEAAKALKLVHNVALTDRLLDGGGYLTALAGVGSDALTLDVLAQREGLSHSETELRVCDQVRMAEAALGWPGRLIGQLKSEVAKRRETLFPSVAGRGFFEHIEWAGLARLTEAVLAAYPRCGLGLSADGWGLVLVPPGFDEPEDDEIPYDALLDHVPPEPRPEAVSAAVDPAAADATRPPDGAHPAASGDDEGPTPAQEADAPLPDSEDGLGSVPGEDVGTPPSDEIRPPEDGVPNDGTAPAASGSEPTRAGPVALPPSLTVHQTAPGIESRPLPGIRRGAARVLFARWPGDAAEGAQLLVSIRETLSREGSAFLFLGDLRWGGGVAALDRAIAASGLSVRNDIVWVAAIPPGRREIAEGVRRGALNVVDRLRRATNHVLHLTRYEAPQIRLVDPDASITEIQGACSNHMGDLWSVHADGNPVPQGLYAMCMAAIGLPNGVCVVDATGFGGEALARAAADMTQDVRVPSEEGAQVLEPDAA